MATPKQTDPQFKLRLTPKLRDEIEKAAGANNRSMNAEILARLEFSLAAHPNAYLIRALVNFHEELLAGKDELEVPQGLEDDIRNIAALRGVSPQKFLTKLLVEAIQHLDGQTELGKELDSHLRDLGDSSKET